MDETYNQKVKRNFHAIVLLHLTFYTCIGFFAVNLKNFLVDLPGTTPMGIGLLTMTGLITGTVSILLFGYYSERLAKKLSRKTIFSITSLCWVLGIALRTISPHYYFFLFSTILFSVGASAAFLPFGYAMIGDSYLPEERAKRFGLMHIALLAGTGLGNIIGAILGNFLGAPAWRVAYGIGALAGTMALIYYWIVGMDPEHGRSEPELQDYRGKIDYQYKINYRKFVQLIRIKPITGILLFEIGVGVQSAALATWTIFYLTELIAIPGALLIATTIPLLGGIGAIVGTAVGGKVGDSYYQRGKIRGRVMISLVGLLVGICFTFIFYNIPFFNTNPEEIVLFTVIFIAIYLGGSFFSSLCVGNIFAIFSEVTVPELRSQANALIGVMVNVGGIFGQFIVAYLININIQLMHSAIILVLLVYLFGISFWIITFVYYPREAKQLRNRMMRRREKLDQMQDYV